MQHRMGITLLQLQRGIARDDGLHFRRASAWLDLHVMFNIRCVKLVIDVYDDGSVAVWVLFNHKKRRRGRGSTREWFGEHELAAV